MTEPSLHYVSCHDADGGHRMAYWQWGNPQSGHVVICVHGLSRQGRDFDVLAQALCAKSPDIRVICPDVVGRGQSDYLKDPQGYQIPAYAADMLTLLAQIKPTTLDWVGTSMGGLIGLVLSGQPDLPLPTSVRRLVLNDVGPVIEWQALQRIGEYLGHPVQFSSVQEAADFLLSISTTFGPHTPKAWLALSRHMVKPMANGSERLVLHYDPNIAVPFRTMTPESAQQSEALLWQLYDQVTAQTLLTRGALSDLLTPETALQMTQRGPKAKLVEFAGIGHAPTFVADDQVNTVASFLLD
jgi:pimeloyl-ACP methyl ester carboxylesterase